MNQNLKLLLNETITIVDSTEGHILSVLRTKAVNRK